MSRPSFFRARHASAALAAAVVFTTLGTAPAQAAPADVIPDAAFKSCINGHLGRPDQSGLTAEDLADITGLYCPNYGVASVDGAEYLTSLEVLDLFRNQVSDVEPLASGFRGGWGVCGVVA